VKLSSIAKAICGLLMVLGGLMLTVPFIDYVYHEPISEYFLVAGILLLGVGSILSRIKAEPLTTLEALVTAAIAWVIIPLISAVVLALQINIDFVDALFESVSGFTGTGFTVLTPSHLKHSILFWRSFMQWTGELGFVVFAMVLIPYFYKIARALYGIERPVKLETTFYRTAIRLILIYLLLTVLGTAAYVLAGMPFFEALNHVMTTVATGGMSTYDNGYNTIYAYAPATYWPFMIFMVLGGMNFIDLHSMFSGKIKRLITSEEFRYYIGSLIFISLLVSLSYHYVEGIKSWVDAFKIGFFNTVSGMTTTGFNIGSLANLKDVTKALITVGMFIGGMTFSTAGGIKSLRLMLFMKKLKHYVQSMISPSSIVRAISAHGRSVSDTDIAAALLFIIVHGIVVVSSALAISAYGYSFTDALFETTSAASCVGLSVNVVSSTAPTGVKLIITAVMLMGRIEYLNVFLLLALIFGRRTIALTRQ